MATVEETGILSSQILGLLDKWESLDAHPMEKQIMYNGTNELYSPQMSRHVIQKSADAMLLIWRMSVS